MTGSAVASERPMGLGTGLSRPSLLVPVRPISRPEVLPRRLATLAGQQFLPALW